VQAQALRLLCLLPDAPRHAIDGTAANLLLFVRDDGSNLEEDVADLLAAVEREGLSLLEAFHDPCAVVRIVRFSRFGICTPSSGSTPLFCGSIQCNAGSSALSAIGKIPHA